MSFKEEARMSLTPAQPAKDVGQFERLVNRYQAIIDRLGAAATRTEQVADKFIGKRPPSTSKATQESSGGSVVGAFELAADEINRRIEFLFEQIERLESLV